MTAPAQQAAQNLQPEVKKKGKTGWALAAVGGLFLLWIIGQGTDDGKIVADGTSAGSADTTSAEPPLAVTATELFRAYDSNEASAQDYYGGRPLLVSGTVSKVSLDFSDDPIVGLETPNQFMSAQASLAENAHSQAGTFNRGDKVKLLCEDVSEIAGTPMLKNCRRAPANQKSKTVGWASQGSAPKSPPIPKDLDKNGCSPTLAKEAGGSCE